MRLLPLLALLVPLLAAACATGGASNITPEALTRVAEGTATPVAAFPTPAGDASPTRPVAASPVPGTCGGELPAGVAAGESNLRQFPAGIDVRTYLLHVPPGFDNSQPAPLVLNFHGLGGLADGQEAVSGLVPLADSEGFLLVSPQGVGAPPSWNFDAGSALFPGGRDDVAFVDGLLDALAAELCIDTHRVYATGFSNGAFFASALACELPHRFAAVAPVAGVDFPAAGCPHAVPMLAFHGEADQVVPFAEGSIFGLLPYAGARANVDGWAEAGGCRPGSDSEQLAPGASMETYDCPGGGQVALVILDGLAHLWPTNANGGVSAAAMIWEFFERYALP